VARFCGLRFWIPFVIRHLSFVIQSAFVQQKSSPERSREKTSGKELKRWDYEPGGGVVSAAAGDSAVAGDSDAAVGDSVVEGGVVASVVAAGGLVAAGLAAGSVVSVFCSHAARSAALARMQIYFFIVLIRRVTLL
jgi:hypothetical protein